MFAMGAATDISPRIKKVHPALAHRVRLEKARADSLELDLVERRGHLISVEEIKARMEKIFGTVRQKILQSSLAPSEQDELINDLAGLKKNSRAK